ncbi:MAG: RNA 2',3'-cyclic phosphodiesterase [Alphaproteobacteria bacterium]|nr:RNA 2',3'-cyclic phosphodiesterase [Alphaproteobacteria bacterium]
MSGMRLLVAIELPDAIKYRLAALCSGLHGAKWTDPAQMHLTLRFVGEVDAPVAGDIADALGQVFAPRFELELAGIGDFTARGRPQVLWVGVRLNAALATLQGKVEAAVRRAGIAPEPRKFHPHVTLARFDRGGGWTNFVRYVTAHEPFAAGPFAVDEFVLFRSVLGSEGATHHVEVTYPLTYARDAAE